MAYIHPQNKCTLVGLLVTYCCLLHLTGANAAIYKWVDNNGNTHYSDQRPKDKDIKHSTFKVRTADKKVNRPDADTKKPQPKGQASTTEQLTTDDNNILQQDNEADAAKQAESQKKRDSIKTARQLRCEQARMNLSILTKDIPAYTNDTGQYRLNWAGDTYTGERNYLDDEARETAYKKAELAIKDYCQNPNDAEAQQMAAKKWARAEYCTLNRAILDDLQRADIRASKRQLNKQQVLTAKYCDDKAIVLSADESALEIFSRQSQ